MRLLPLFAATLYLCTSPAFALNILVSNDDGLTSNLRALHAALSAAGHRVIVSVPCTGQSGRGAAIVMYSTETIVPDNDKTQIDAERGCHNGAAPLGAPAVGPFTRKGYRDGSFHYVHGTPVMATLYGLDVLAPRIFGRAPDLVLSGPNEGQNLGPMVNSSGTVSNAQFAASRGIPAIALSASAKTRDDRRLAHADSAVVAALSIRLVATLQQQAGSAPLLPPGLALNVNFPDRVSADTSWALTRHGHFNPYQLQFHTTPPYGIHFRPNPAPAANAAQAQDEGLLNRHLITVTPMQIGFDHDPAAHQLAQRVLRKLMVAPRPSLQQKQQRH